MSALLEAPALQCRHLLRIARRATNDLDDSHLALEPHAGLKTAGWLIGHLAVTGDFGRRLLGHPQAICPVEWREHFKPGSKPSLDRADYAAMAELRAALQRVYDDLAEAAATADESMLVRQNPLELTRREFARVGDFAAYLLAGHFGYHLGQLSTWRAAAGLPVLGSE